MTFFLLNRYRIVRNRARGSARRPLPDPLHLPLLGPRAAQPRSRLRQIVRNIPNAVRATFEKVSECFDAPPRRAP